MFQRYPYINYAELNLDYLLKLANEVNTKLDEYLESAVIHFGDPITWNITSQYTKNTMVIDADGTAYLSKQPVPVGIDIRNSDYWQSIFNYDDNINKLRDNIAYNSGNTGIVERTLHTDDLVWFAGELYILTNDVTAGGRIIPETNAEKITVELFVDLMKDAIDSEREARQNADTALGVRIDAEQTARQNAISAEQTARTEAINAEANARSGADTTINNRIDMANSAISNISGHMTTIENDVEALKSHTVERNIILIGDSYATGVGTEQTTSYVAIAQPILSGNRVNLYNCAKGGCSFGGNSPYNYLDALQETESSVPVPRANISEVWIVGGHNDLGYSVDDMYPKAMTLVNYIRATYPNAVIKVCDIGMSTDPQMSDALLTLPARYNELASRIGAQYVAGLERFLSNGTYMMNGQNNDYAHPVQRGQTALGYAFANIVLNGTVDIYQQIEANEFYMIGSTEVNYIEGFAGYWRRYNDSALLYHNQVTVKPLARGGEQWWACDGTHWLNLGQMITTMVYGGSTTWDEYPTPFFLKSGGNYYHGTGFVRFDGNRLLFAPCLGIGASTIANYDVNSEIILPAGTFNFTIK